MILLKKKNIETAYFGYPSVSSSLYGSIPGKQGLNKEDLQKIDMMFIEAANNLEKKNATH